MWEQLTSLGLHENSDAYTWGAKSPPQTYEDTTTNTGTSTATNSNREVHSYGLLPQGQDGQR